MEKSSLHGKSQNLCDLNLTLIELQNRAEDTT